MGWWWPRCPWRTSAKRSSQTPRLTPNSLPVSEPGQTYTLLGMLCDMSCRAAPRAQPCKGKAARFPILFQPPANGGSQ